QVDDRVHPFDRCVQASWDEYVPLREGHGEVHQRGEVGGRAVKTADRVPRTHERPNHMPPQEAGGPCDQDVGPMTPPPSGRSRETVAEESSEDLRPLRPC
ncbi:MAG: hypothetical protein LN410_04725, partial [Candidatus Thermoplasmatota archaeon]|nr:hypothetical protein [Candidatus Thermoplasmatota archaeon]